MRFRADAEILFPNTQSFASGRRVRGVTPKPIAVVAVGDEGMPSHVQAVKFGETWFVRGNLHEASVLDRLVEGSRG